MFITDLKGQQIELSDGVVGTSSPPLVTSMAKPDNMPQYFIIVAAKRQGASISNVILIPGLDYVVGETTIDFPNGMDYNAAICIVEMATGVVLEPIALAKPAAPQYRLRR